MRKTSTMKLMAIILAGTCLMSGMAVNAADDDKVYEIKLTSTDTATTIWHQEHFAMAERIKERTDGHVDIQFYGNGEFLVYDEGIEAVMSDAAVFYFAEPTLFVDYCPELKTVCAPYLWEDYMEIEAFEETDIYQDILKKAEEQNLHTVTPLTAVGSRHILADRPVTCAEDCKGLSIRVPTTEIYAETFGALGCNYQSLLFSETYNALETGMISGVETTPGNLIGNRPDESMKGDKYYSLTNHILNLAALYCGEGFWNTLPEEYQEIITEEAAASAHTINKAVYDSIESDMETIEGYGITIVDVPDKSSFREALTDVYANMADWDIISAKAEEIRAAK